MARSQLPKPSHRSPPLSPAPDNFAQFKFTYRAFRDPPRRVSQTYLKRERGGFPRLEGLAVELGLLVASAILEDEVTRLCGRRYERRPERRHTRDGDMRRRRCVAGLLRAESKFRRVKGHRDMPTLKRALEESTLRTTVWY